MEMKLKIIVLLGLDCIMAANTQNNAKTVLSQYLKECYSDPWLVNRNNLPPMTLPVLLDIVRKIEDHPNTIADIRQVSTGIVHMFRQDGIVYDPTAASSQNIVPFSPTGFPAYKNRLLLTKLIPDNQFHLTNDIISPEEKCALHHMVSSSLYTHSRGDEEWTCNSITKISRSSRLTQYDKSQDIEVFNVNGVVDILGRQIIGVSPCPIETGVVSTRWGDVSMGTVITGVSSGQEEQNVLVTDLVTIRSGFNNNTIVVNNRYASTLSGDIAEAAIRQGTSLRPITVGASGGWNSTNARRHYFVSKNTDLEFTDAEIRGGLDGLILSELGAAYATTFPGLKLSQLIDMYYSDSGVLHEARFRACNRKVLVPDIAARETLLERSLGPAIALYHVSTLSGTTNMRGIQKFINDTVDAFRDYIPHYINDPICPTVINEVLRPKINLILITEPITSRSQHISFVVDQIEVGKFGSSITLMHSQTGEILVDKTFSLANFYQEFAKKMVPQTGTLNMLRVLKALRELADKEMKSEHSNHYCGGNATIALFLTNTIPITGDERVQAIHHAEQLRRWAPDLRLLFATSRASEDAVGPILHHPDDFIPISLTTPGDVSNTLSPLLDVLRSAPRRIVNPVCGVEWVNEDSGTIGFDDFVDAGGINLYRLIPNYFYDNNIARVVRIQSTEEALSVCYSRTNVFPRRNRTSSTVPADVVCSSATNSGIVEVDLGGACVGYSSIQDCPPLYLTVSSTMVPIKMQCTESGCRYPNDVKYLVVAHELGCFNNGVAACGCGLGSFLIFMVSLAIALDKVIN